MDMQTVSSFQFGASRSRSKARGGLNSPARSTSQERRDAESALRQAQKELAAAQLKNADAQKRREETIQQVKERNSESPGSFNKQA